MNSDRTLRAHRFLSVFIRFSSVFIGGMIFCLPVRGVPKSRTNATRVWIGGPQVTRPDLGQGSTIATYLLTWNRALWPWEHLREDMRTIESQGCCPHVWGCGVTRRIVPGDRVFLMKVGREPRGLVGSGWVVTPVYEEVYTDAAGRARASRCVEVHFDALLDPDEEIFPRAWLQVGIYTRMHWSPQASGVSIPAQVAAQLEADWARFLGRPGPT